MKTVMSRKPLPWTGSPLVLGTVRSQSGVSVLLAAFLRFPNCEIYLFAIYALPFECLRLIDNKWTQFRRRNLLWRPTTSKHRPGNKSVAICPDHLHLAPLTLEVNHMKRD